MIKRRWAAIGLVLVAGMAAGGWWWMGPGRAAQAAAAKPAGSAEKALEFLPSEVTRPALQAMPRHLEFSGPLVARQSAVVRAKAVGRLVRLTVSEGSRVRAGQVVGQLELPDQASRVAERAALLEVARATLAQAERTHAQNERLAAQQFISSAALDSSRSQVDTARAQWQAAQAALDTQRVGLRDTQLVAPIDGIVARRHVLPGEQLAPEQDVLSVVDLGTLELAGSVAVHDVSRLSVGALVSVMVEGQAQPVQGRLARIAPAAEAGTRAIGVAIDVPNPQERLRAGQYALARVTQDDPVQRLTLPAAAVGSTSGQAHVWAIEQGQLKRRAVTVGRRDDARNRVEVLEGVGADHQVLAMRFDNLREGAKAQVVAASAGRAGAAASAPASASAGASPPVASASSPR